MLIAQLSDLHVRARGALYQGVVDSNARVAQAIEHLNRLDRRPDLVLVTGDLVDQGHPDEYAMVRALLERLGVPYLVIPGNHDDRETFRAAFSDHRYLPEQGPLHYCVDDYAVRIVALDSCVPGKHHGHIEAEGLSWLSSRLEQARDKPTLLMMHHPPFVSGIPYMDKYRYIDAGPLEEVVERFPQVQILLCGHVHRSMLRRWAGTVVCTGPSTTTQIDLQLTPHAPPQSHAGPRGYMLHLWDEAHGLISHTNLISDDAGPFGFA
jgi:3',5'-cyclic AMP phosphodiesterase CpdA